MRERVARLSDAELVVLARDGDAAAFGELYDRHSAGVARALASFAGADAHALDDLVQDVFFKVMDGLADYVPRRPFQNWLYTIALNTGRNHVRSRAREIAVDPADFEKMALQNDSNEQTSDLFGLRLTRLVAALPEPLREVVSLRIGSDLSFAEIAEMLGIPEGTARSRMHTALESLRARLGVHDAGEKE